MFNSDKGIRMIHRKNSCYVLIFCILHLPLIITMSISFIIEKNNYGDNPYRFLFTLCTYLDCLIPFIMSIVRKIQGIFRLDCISNCIRKKKRNEILSGKKVNYFRRYTNCAMNDPSLISDPFEWLDSHIMEYFMRDILLGVAVSLQKSKQYDHESKQLKPQDFRKYSKYE